MNCPVCGAKQTSKKRKTCSECGAPLITSQKINESTTLDMTCPNCNGQMDYSEDKSMLVCPYCDTKIMLTESDEVKLEKIRNERMQKEYEASLRYSNPPKKKKENKLKTVGKAIVNDYKNTLKDNGAARFIQMIKDNKKKK